MIIKKKGIYYVKKILVVVISVVLSIAAVFSAGCAFKSCDNATEDVYDYYGCPNSKRIKKLNLKKHAYK